MENEFNKTMSSRTTDELIKITQLERDNYQKKALEAAENELKKRNVSVQEIDNVTQNLINVEEQKNEIKYNTVSSSLRFFNFLIDTLVWSIIAFILTLPLNANNKSEVFVGYLIMIVSYILYYAVFEITTQKTIGKMITKTKVVTYDEEIPSNTDIIIRTLLRLIPFDFISYLFARNGLHDALSKTKVVKVI